MKKRAIVPLGDNLPMMAYTVKFPFQTLAKLNTIKALTGASVSEQIRRGIDLWLKQQEAGR